MKYLVKFQAPYNFYPRKKGPYNTRAFAEMVADKIKEMTPKDKIVWIEEVEE